MKVMEKENELPFKFAKNIYVGEVCYLMGQGDEPEYYYSPFLVVDDCEKNASKRFIDYAMKCNPSTKRELWQVCTGPKKINTAGIGLEAAIKLFGQIKYIIIKDETK